MIQINRGVRLAIDDFGSGYASLSHLKQLPVDVLKIDKSFVQNLGTNEEDEAIVRSTIELAHSLGIRVVAEGVETEAILVRLTDLGCDMAQGYWLSRPFPTQQLTSWLRTPSARHKGKRRGRRNADLARRSLVA